MGVKMELYSEILQRTVQVFFFNCGKIEPASQHRMLLVNDGQDLLKINFDDTLNITNTHYPHSQLLITAIASSESRSSEYGMAIGADYKGWGSKAGAYSGFVIDELVPFIKDRYNNVVFDEWAIAGFSLGGLSAVDIAWNHPEIFTWVGAFSASFGWRSVDKYQKHYDPWRHRMMHRQVALSEKREGMKFLFEFGELLMNRKPGIEMV